MSSYHGSLFCIHGAASCALSLLRISLNKAVCNRHLHTQTLIFQTTAISIAGKPSFPVQTRCKPPPPARSHSPKFLQKLTALSSALAASTSTPPRTTPPGRATTFPEAEATWATSSLPLAPLLRVQTSKLLQSSKSSTSAFALLQLMLSTYY